MASLRSLLGRRARHPSPARSDVQAADLLVRTVKRAQARTYATGLEDGCRIALELLLGRESNGGAPFTGDLPADARGWAEDALGRLNGVGAAGIADDVVDLDGWPRPNVLPLRRPS